MANLQIVDRTENEASATVTLTVRDADNPDDPGALYHYAAKGPSGIAAEDWQRQTEAHAIGLEARSRGIEPPAASALSHPGELGAMPGHPDALSADEQAELERERTARAAADQVARDRAELEQLRASAHDQEQPPA